MSHIPRHSTNNTSAAMLDSDQPSSSAPPSSGTNSSTRVALVTTAPTFTLSQQDLTLAFSQTLGNALPQILATLQSHSTSSGSTTLSLVGNLVSSTTSSIASSPPLSFPSCSFTDNVVVPSFISTYCMCVVPRVDGYPPLPSVPHHHFRWVLQSPSHWFLGPCHRFIGHLWLVQDTPRSQRS